MASAEARAGWQRTANRYFAQEDARRAPKIPYGPYPSSSQSDTVHRNEANESSRPTKGYTPGGRNQDAMPDTKWWLHLQPNSANESDLLYEQLKSFEAELEIMRAGYADQSAKISCNYKPIEVNSRQIDISNVVDLFSDQPRKISSVRFRNEQNPEMPELKAEIGNIPTKTAKNMGVKEIWYTDDHLMMGLFPSNGSISEQPKNVSSELESHWEVEMEKNAPWWRTSDKDELASLVAQKSLEHIENCDLPRPQVKHLRQGPSASLEYFSHDLLFNSYDHNSEMGGSRLTNCMHGTPTSVNVIDKHYCLGDMERTSHGLDKPHSENENYTTKKDIKNASESSPSKAQILEALCHSQSRAREAEKAAQEAYSEKEHIIKLVFKQASQLFAYKQWFRLLQLENLCLQLKNKNGPICNLFPISIPSNPNKSCPPKKDQPTTGKKKRNTPMYEITRCAVAFAVGLSLAGAGLLLGWTMGWLFPAF